ncbi:lysozyme [Philodulcilactobacillus myokoensis]|uniref:Lysozyme n=1 Tax=Philodulcilactobacillus myokoensis TaxID=2929573 RepID=A0A9W6AZY3_9LACO|nr:GH25 family lysozyme [Philodulcilactobacillus myokoensis]GLB46332.1 lysozyme [Philodulcilactobacillus myokoensis]
MKKFYQKIILIAVACLGIGLFAGFANHNVASASSHQAYDLSEWQSNISSSKAKKLKHEVGFVILRGQFGSSYQDRTFKHNSKMMEKYHIPYGVYSYSQYTSSASARNEAKTLYHRAPKAKFYVNDFEQNLAHNHANAATKAWAKEIHRLTSRPAVLYSGLYFINQNVGNAKKSYNAIWLASYSSSKPRTNFKYDLWQYTDNHKSKSLKESVDASVMVGNKPLSFWTGQKSHTIVVK